MKKFLLVNFLFMCTILGLSAQDRKVSGKVTSAEDGSALPGVSIQLKGTNKGTQTGADGTYSIAVPSAGGTLTFSFVGMSSKDIAIGSKSVVDYSMQNDTRALSEVVVTGTGAAVDKRSLAIDVAAVRAKDLPPVPSASIDQALVGKIAGAQISSTNGNPGQPVNILLRGVNTINRGTSPMILMDGLQMAATDLNTVDLNMIDRVEVVQGAAASSMYGAQGANGVIQLFTKKGKAGKINVDISSSVINGSFINSGGLRKADLHGFVTNANNEVIGGSGKPLTLDPEYGSYGENLSWNSTDPTVKINKPYDKNLQYYDHFKMFFVPTTNTNNSVAISGGSAKSDFNLSFSNNYQQSPFKDLGDLNRTNLTINLGAELAKGLKLRSITQLIYTNNTINDGSGRNTVYSVFNSRPFANYEFKDLDGNYPAYMGDATGVNGYNPNYANTYSSTKGTYIDVVQNLALTYKLPKFVTLDAKYGLNYANKADIYTYLNQSGNKNAVDQQYWYSNFNGTDANGELNNYTSQEVFQNAIATATIATDFEKDFNLSLPIRTTTQVGFDYRNTNFKRYDSYGIGLPNYFPFNTSQATTQRVFRDFKEPFITYGYLVDQRVDYGDLAGISGGFRTDYSSAFGAGSTPFTFPHGNAYVRLSSLDFWKNSKLGSIFTDMKVRAAYGEAGIQPRPFDRYVTLGTRTIGASNSFFFPLAQSNPDLSVEVSKETEIGTDLGFKVGKGAWLEDIGISASYWKRSTDNAIYRIDAAPSTGTGSLLDNAFSLASNGFQFSLNASIYKSKDITWNLTTNFGKQTSEITAVRGGAEVVITSAAGSTGYVLKAGQKIGQLFGFYAIHSLDELAPDGTPALPEASRSAYEVASNGWVVNKTTKAPYFTPKQYSFGDPNPKFNMSFINDFNIKNIVNINFQLDWIHGAHLYNQTKEWMYRDGIHADYQVPFSIGGQEGAWSAFYRGIYAERSRNGTKNYFYEDASFVRLRNVSVAVDLARAFSIKGVRKLQLVLTGRNLMTFTNYTGMDPEISSGTTNSAWDRGTDHNTIPNQKSYQVGLNIGL